MQQLSAAGQQLRPERPNLKSDLVAGLTFAIVNVPQELSLSALTTASPRPASAITRMMRIAMEPTVPAKAMTEYIKASGINMKVLGGFLPNSWLSEKQIEALATLPSREVLIGRVVGGLSGPIYGLVNSLTSPMLGLVWALQARIKQMEG